MGNSLKRSSTEKSAQLYGRIAFFFLAVMLLLVFMIGRHQSELALAVAPFSWLITIIAVIEWLAGEKANRASPLLLVRCAGFCVAFAGATVMMIQPDGYQQILPAATFAFLASAFAAVVEKWRERRAVV